MSEDNIKTSVKSNDLTRNKDTEANSWIIGVSKSHPGQKYYFNTVTGVSLWNISGEDIERAQQQFKVSESPCQYFNYPEPKEPPPNRRISTKHLNQMHCQHSVQTPRSTIKQIFTNESSTNVSYSLKNTSSNTRPCPLPECTSKPQRHINVIPQSRMISPPLLDSNMFERNATHRGQHRNKSKPISRSIWSPKRLITENMSQDVGIVEAHSQSSNDKDWIEENNCESIDLALLKQFAKSDTFEDKWYIIADASVYLQDINLITTILDNDDKCCLIITQNVKAELENAIKTPLREKAHYANYIIYKLLFYGFAVTDEDILKQNQDIIINNSVLNCCLKLKEQNFYVVVITNDLELEKYGQFHVPIFTLRELKKCLSKTNNFVATPSLTPSSVTSHSDNKTKLNTPDIMVMLSNARMPEKYIMKRTNSDLTVEENSLQSQTALAFNGTSTRSSIDFKDTKTTTDVEVQTDLTLIELEKMEYIYQKICLTKQIDDCNKETENPLSRKQSCESLPPRINQGTSKHIKLKRRKTREQLILQEQPNVNVIQTNSSNTVKIYSTTHNILENKNFEEQNESSSHIFPEYKNNNNENQKLDKTNKSSNRTLQEIPNKKCNTHSNQYLTQERNENNETIEDKNVMFEVTSEIMEESLKNNCDEWVTKFVQIMEKALIEVLKRNSLCLSPWNLYKATAYIKENISDDPDIVDASTKLLNVLNQVRDGQGGINTNINPTTYMEMYSFGVYLIDALQGKFDTCEDLQVAAESLSKLLNDIQNPTLDPGDEKVEVLMIIDTDSLNDEICENTDKQEHFEEENSFNEAFNDIRRKNNESETFRNHFISSSTNVAKENNPVQFKVNIPCTTFLGTSKTIRSDQGTFTETKTKSASPKKFLGSPSTYNLRSRQRRTSDLQEASQCLLQEDIIFNCRKSLFLSNFQLQEKPNHDGSYPLNTANENAGNIQSRNMEINEERVNQAENDSSKLLDAVHVPEQRVIRNFVRCLEFEERLRNNKIYDELNNLDYEDEHMETEYIDESLCDKRGSTVSDEYAEFYDSNNPMDNEIESNKEDVKIDLKYVITKIAKEIGEISSEVYGFSSRAKWILISAPEDKNDIREKAGHCYLYINQLCATLNSILFRDRNGTYNIQTVLDTTEFGDLCVDEGQMEVYGEFIASCLEQAQTLKEVIKDILSALRVDEGTDQIES